MTSSVESSSQNQNHPPNSGWSALVSYAVPPCAAAAAIVPAFPDLMAKSAQQCGEPVSSKPLTQQLAMGARAAPIIGATVGAQMGLQALVEQRLFPDADKDSLAVKAVSSAVVGTASGPALAIFNGKTMGLSFRESLRRFGFKQAGAIGARETAFVGGVSATDLVAHAMKERFGDNPAVEAVSAFSSGALSSLIGHPADTALTRWQSNLPVTLRTSMLGAARKARGVGLFSLGYHYGKKLISYALEKADKANS